MDYITTTQAYDVHLSPEVNGRSSADSLSGKGIHHSLVREHFRIGLRSLHMLSRTRQYQINIWVDNICIRVSCPTRQIWADRQ